MTSIQTKIQRDREMTPERRAEKANKDYLKRRKKNYTYSFCGKMSFKDICSIYKIRLEK